MLFKDLLSALTVSGGTHQPMVA